MKKRILSFTMFLCLLFLCVGSGPVYSNAKDLAGKTNYTAFGDSIAAGYGLKGYSADQSSVPKKSYQALVSNFLKTQSHNYAVSGDDSDACIRLLESGAADADLKDTDVITLSIGSNDLLLPFIQIVMDFFHIDPDTIPDFNASDFNASDFNVSDFAESISLPKPDPSQMLNYYKQLQELLALLKDNDTLHAQAQVFREKLQTIISTLHTKAPKAEIYVSNIYDPFYFVPVLKELSEVYITEINQAFSADAPDYTLVDVYTPFTQDELTNINLDINLNTGDFSNLNPDPHPSVKGHQVIADCFIQALKDDHAPKAPVIKTVLSDNKYKLTAKLKLPTDADGCRLSYATSKNGKYQTLAETSKKTFQTNSGRLKSGKTYYIKAAAYRTINGVTYYGKTGSAKKITIRSS